MAAIDWILFDCDGVLLDSEAVVLRALTDTVTERIGVGHDISPEIGALLGLQVDEILAELERRYGVPFDADFVARTRHTVDNAHRHHSAAVRDVDWALQRIPLNKAVVSNSRLAHMQHALARTNLARHFEGCLFSAEQVDRPKPSPDLYEFAALRLGTVPGRCLVVEDSATGVGAAVRAGMTVIGFTGGGHLPREHSATQRSLGAIDSVHSMRELPSVVADILASRPGKRDFINGR